MWLQTMREELAYQDKVFQNVDDHVDKTKLGLAQVQQSAEKTLGKKGEQLSAI